MSKVLAVEPPKSQSVDAVLSLLTAMGVHRESPPASVKMSDSCFLVLSARGEEYYTVTRRACSCPSSVYHPGTVCKHQKKYLGMIQKPARIATIPSAGFKPVLCEEA